MDANELAQLIARIEVLEKRFAGLYDGNGVPGFRTLVADVYGDARRGQSGLVARMSAVEKKQDMLLSRLQWVLGLLGILVVESAPKLYEWMLKLLP